MNTHDDNNIRPLGYWLRVVDRLLAAEFARAFEAEGATRRDWRLLNAVDGTVAPGRPLRGHKLLRLVERGWATHTEQGFALTDEGRAAKERLGDMVAGIRARVAKSVPAEDLATTLATLEQIARAFGWTEDARMPRGHGRRGPRGHRRHGFRKGGAHRHGFGPAGRHGFGPARGHEDDHDFGTPGRRGHDGFGHRWGHRGAPFLGIARFGQRSYERGFEAGFARGRDS